MGTFTKIPQSTFDDLQVNAGVLLKTFNPASPSISDSAIITATTGGIQVSCTPTYSDWGEDVDNAPNNTKELKHLDGWDCKINTTALGTSPELIKMSLGAADINGQTTIIPRADLSQDDFDDALWWVGDKADGGLVAIKVINALSTGGFSLQTTKNGKGQLTLEITGHVSIDDQDTVPMEFYSLSGEDVQTEYVFTAVSPIGTENPVNEGWYVLIGDNYRVTSDTEVDDNVTYYERTVST